jgi:hypothetical protein
MEKPIQINQLLLEREEVLSELFDLELQISMTLGQHYPFDLPRPLPSLQKRKPVRPRKPAQPMPFRLRDLDEETETAYRIFYRDQDTNRQELHTDPHALHLLLDIPLPHIAVQRIETVSIQDGKITPLATLYPTS